MLFQMHAYVICQICESYHDSIEELNAHYEKDHPTGNKKNMTSDGKYKCDDCERAYMHLRHLYSHQRKAHGRALSKKRRRGQGTVECDVCGQYFHDNSGMNRHKRNVHKIYDV